MDEPIAWRVVAENSLSRMKALERRLDEDDLGDGKLSRKGELWFSITDQPTLTVASSWQATAEGNGFSMVTCDPNEMVTPIHSIGMITILPLKDCDTRLRGSYDDVVALRWPYETSSMAVRRPVFPTRQSGRQNSTFTG